jgi:hypothetical protein
MRCEYFEHTRIAGTFVPKQEMKKAVAIDIRGIFGSIDRRDAEERLSRMTEKYRKSTPCTGSSFQGWRYVDGWPAR